MDVRKLKNTLEERADKPKVNNMLTSVSHWVRRIFDSNKGQYETADFNDIETLEKLVELGIVSMRRGSDNSIVAELTKEGKELYMDFTKLGYYL